MCTTRMCDVIFVRATSYKRMVLHFLNAADPFTVYVQIWSRFFGFNLIIRWDES